MRFLFSLGIGCVAWTLIAGEPKAISNSVGIKLVPIPAGSFEMGTAAAPPKSMAEYAQRDYDESPAHRVTISKPFLMGVYEVTNAQYEQFDPGHKTLRGRDEVSKTDDEPVTFVTWNQAVAFCEWLSKKEGKPYRLPTEAEWEYACRAGTTTPFSTGDKITEAQANIGAAADGKPQLTTKVGSYPANAWGLHDLHGNVVEWCLDWHGPYEAGEQTDPVGRAAGYAKIARGWCFAKPEKVLGFALKYWRSSNRSGFLPVDANRLTGFRVVQGELPATKPLPEVLPLNRQNVKQDEEPVVKGGQLKPAYINFVASKTNAEMPKDAFGPIFANHNHFAAVCVCPNGDVLACWYSTVSEQGRELAQAATRLRFGSDQWEPASAFFDVPDVNDHAPVLLRDGKRIWHFCTQSLRGWDNASNIARYSDDSGATWSQPTIILSRDDPKALSQPCSAFVKDGKITLACDGDNHKDERLIVSPDHGKTWKVAAGDMRATAGKYAIHPAIAPTADGRIVNFLRGPDPMPVQFSKDDGATWSQQNTPFPGIKSGQKAVALRLNSGNLLFISIDNTKKVVEGGGTFAALSMDDGQTWPHVRKLEGVGGYMAAAQSPKSGLIFAVGSRMSSTLFNEEWLKEGKAFPPGK